MSYDYYLGSDVAYVPSYEKTCTKCGAQVFVSKMGYDSTTEANGKEVPVICMACAEAMA